MKSSCVALRQKLLDAYERASQLLLHFPSSFFQEGCLVYPFYSCNFLSIKKNRIWYILGLFSVIPFSPFTSKIALAKSANVYKDGAIEIGKDAQANGSTSISIGDTSTTLGAFDVAVGPHAYANGYGTGAAIALGTGAVADSIDAIAVGHNTQSRANWASVFGVGSEAYAYRATALGAYAKVYGGDDDAVALGSYAVTRRATSVSSVTLGGVNYRFAGTSPIAVMSVGSGGQERQIVNVAAGDISGGSTDAVNGSQLYATNQSVNTLNKNMNDGSVGVIQRQTDSDGKPTGVAVATQVDKTANDPGVPQKLTNLAAGDISGGSTDAVNGSQLYATNQNVSTLNKNMNDGSVGVIQRQTDSDGKPTGVAAVTQFGRTANDPGAPQKLTNLAVGELSSTSTDAVNGSQLYATNQYMNQGFRVLGGSINSLSEDVMYGVTGIVQRQVDVNGKQTNVAVLTELGKIANAPGAPQKLTNLASGELSATSMEAVNGSQLYAANKNIDILSKSVSGGPAGIVQRQTDTNGKLTGVSVLVADGKTANDPGTPQKLTNVASGELSSTSTDAVNGSQLYQTVSSATKNVVTYDDDHHKKVTLHGGDSDAPVTISNVAAAQITDESSEAVRGSQLYHNAHSVARNFGGGAKVNPDGSISEPSYIVAGKTYNDVGGALDGLKNYTDSTSLQTLRDAHQYTDDKFKVLSGMIDKVRIEARQAAAIGLAVSSLRYDSRPGKFSMAMGAGSWRGYSAGAFGVGYTNPTQTVRANMAVTSVNSHVGMGAGLSFTLN